MPAANKKQRTLPYAARFNVGTRGRCGVFQYLARQSGEQSSIGFQPVSSHQPASLFVSRRSGVILLEQEREQPSSTFDTGWKPVLLYAVAVRSGYEEARLQGNFNTR
jgi:hypothetical protein